MLTAGVRSNRGVSAFALRQCRVDARRGGTTLEGGGIAAGADAGAVRRVKTQRLTEWEATQLPAVRGGEATVRLSLPRQAVSLLVLEPPERRRRAVRKHALRA